MILKGLGELICPACQSKNIKMVSVQIFGQTVRTPTCSDCGFIPDLTKYYKPTVSQPQKLVTLDGRVRRVQKAKNFTMDEIVSFAVPEPTGLVCPQCFGVNLEQNPGLRRHDANGITHGYICQDCGEAFIEHPDLRQKPPMLKLDAAKNPVQYRKRQKQIDGILDDANRGSGQWLKPRKDKDEGGMFFEVGK